MGNRATPGSDRAVSGTREGATAVSFPNADSSQEASSFCCRAFEAVNVFNLQQPCRRPRCSYIIPGYKQGKSGRMRGSTVEAVGCVYGR